MRVRLKELQSNPFRDFKIDPLEDADTEILSSINESGFWGGAPVRKKKDGTLEIGAGHRRIYHAIKAGIEYADLDVRERSDAEMIRIYATENVTQRGDNTGLAMAGAVASAVRYLVKGLLKGDEDVWQICQTSEKSREIVLGQITGDKGLGRDCIMRFYKGIGGIKESVVQHHLANLKASGDYARIIRLVEAEIEREHTAEVAELERKEREAEAAKEASKVVKVRQKKEETTAKHGAVKATAKKASTAAAHRKVTFDLAGVGQHLKTENQIRVFRQIVETNKSIQKYLPVENQAALAASLVTTAAKLGKELSGEFIKQHVAALVMDVAQRQGRINRKEREAMEAEDVHFQWANLQDQFCHSIWSVNRYGERAAHLLGKYPPGHFKISTELRNAVSYAKPTINELAAKLGV